MEAVIKQLYENVQLLYRKAVDADRALDQLKGQGKAKHRSVFPKEAGFQVTGDRFVPYIAELSEDIASLAALQENGEEKEFNAFLSTVVKKMESLFVILAKFKGVLAE